MSLKKKSELYGVAKPSCMAPCPKSKRRACCKPIGHKGPHRAFIGRQMAVFEWPNRRACR